MKKFFIIVGLTLCTLGVQPEANASNFSFSIGMIPPVTIIGTHPSHYSHYYSPFYYNNFYYIPHHRRIAPPIHKRYHHHVGHHHNHHKPRNHH